VGGVEEWGCREERAGRAGRGEASDDETVRMSDDGKKNNQGGLEEEAFDRDFKLISNDGRTFSLKARHAMTSKLVKVALEGDTSSEEIKFDCSGHILKHIVDYMNYCKGNEAISIVSPIEGDPRKSIEENWKMICGERNRWYATFMWGIGMNRKDLALLTTASNQYQIEGLLKLCISLYATFLKFCAMENINRILDPSIKDGKLLPMRPGLKDGDTGDRKEGTSTK